MARAKDRLAFLPFLLRAKVEKSDQPATDEKLDLIRRQTPETRNTLVCQHFSLGVAWDEALADCGIAAPPEPNDTTPTATVSDITPSDDATATVQPDRQIRRFKLSALRPNQVNHQVFDRSLEDESIRALAEDIKRHGLRHSIEATADGVIVDGERRWLALRLLGVEEIDVVVVAESMAEEQVEEAVWDAYSATRAASIREKVRAYRLGLNVLQRRHGRPPGRPGEKDPQLGDLFWSPQKIRREAARQAGLRSAETARRALAVFESSYADLQRSLDDEEVSVSAAHKALQQRETPDAVVERQDEPAEAQDAPVMPGNKSSTRAVPKSDLATSVPEDAPEEDDAAESLAHIETEEHGSDGDEPCDHAADAEDGEEAEDEDAETVELKATTVEELTASLVEAVRHREKAVALDAVVRIANAANVLIWTEEDENDHLIDILTDRVADLARADPDAAGEFRDRLVSTIDEMMTAAAADAEDDDDDEGEVVEDEGELIGVDEGEAIVDDEGEVIEDDDEDFDIDDLLSEGV